MRKNIPLFKIYYEDDDINSVKKAIELGMYWAIGPSIEQFEKLIAEYFGVKYCTVFNSGTSALHAALTSHGIQSGDEIIVPSFTFIATANAPLFVQAKPVFADIEPVTFGLDSEDVSEKITQKTKAIIPVHYGGCPAQIQALKEIAEDNGILLIEDVAESFGSKINGKMTGVFGDSAMLSFCQNKVITTGEGGAIITNSKDLFKKLLLFRSHGRLDDGDYFSNAYASEYIELGYNFRMSNLTASLGISQLSKVEKIINMRINVAQNYLDRLKNINDILLPNVPENGRHVFQLFSIRTNESFRNDLITFLKSKGISSKIYFSPVHQTHFYKTVLKYDVQLPVTETISKETLSLPIYPTMTVEEQDYVIEMIQRFFEARTLGEDN